MKCWCTVGGEIRAQTVGTLTQNVQKGPIRRKMNGLQGLGGAGRWGHCLLATGVLLEENILEPGAEGGWMVVRCCECADVTVNSLDLCPRCWGLHAVGYQGPQKPGLEAGSSPRVTGQFLKVSYKYLIFYKLA